MPITEFLLEMHYHRPLLELFTNNFGKGGVDFCLYKYSQSKERFVGFDQAYALTDMGDMDFYNMVKAASEPAKGTVGSLMPKFLCFFLQYKVVRGMRNKSKHLPVTITSKPYYRAKLDTARKSGDPSQHERLFTLSRRPTCFVYYACPMIFDKTDLYHLDPPLQDLALADVATCMSSYTDNDEHFVYYDKVDSDPVWRSEPVDGKAIRPGELATKLDQRLRDHTPQDLANSVLDDISSAGEADTQPHKTFSSFKAGLRVLGDTAWFIRLG